MKNEQSVAKRSQKRQFWAKQESMPRHGFAMPQHEKDPIQKPESYMPQHDEGMPRHAKVGLIAYFEGMPQHDQFMPRHDDVYETYFWQLGFNAF